MHVRLLFVAVLTVISPSLAVAMCGGHDEVTMSCPEGQSFDSETSSCKPAPTT